VDAVTTLSASKVRLAALGVQLSARGFEAVLSGSVLKVVNPDEPGCCGRRLGDSITCRSRQEDGGRLWFFTSWNEPIEPADRVVDTGLRIQGYLRASKR